MNENSVETDEENAKLLKRGPINYSRTTLGSEDDS